MMPPVDGFINDLASIEHNTVKQRQPQALLGVYWSGRGTRAQIKPVMYIDGLFETRRGVIDDDIEALRRSHAAGDVDPNDLADEPLADFADRTNRSDDIAIICARLA